MPELLLELLSEEIPARLQRRAAEQLREAVIGALDEHGLTHDGARAFATPRRLALTVTGVPARSPDVSERRKGPRLGAPDKAIAGFVRAAGLKSIDQAETRADPKGDYYEAVIERPGAETTEILAEAIPSIVAGFAWPKSMRWGAGRVGWIRPLRSVVATFGARGQAPVPIAFEIDGLESGATTYGHRFLAPGPIPVKRFADYERALEKAHVMLDLDRRREAIAHDAAELAFGQSLAVIEDDALLEEVAGLVEWPVVMMGGFDEKFLALPEEVIVTTIRANQKCFCLRTGKDGRLANRFILVSNLIAGDGGDQIVAGNERVIRARLADAKFFHDIDLGTPLQDRLPRLEKVVFHDRLGTQRERVDRLVALATGIAPLVGADRDAAARAALLAKADLVTDMVVEFPELQGTMGRYYASAQGETDAVANAIEMHYKPAGPSDDVPSEPVAIAVALADKLDLLAGFWAIDEKPTGSKDPYALRRAALGVIRIVLENTLTLPLFPLLAQARIGHDVSVPVSIGEKGDVETHAGRVGQRFLTDLLSFFHERLKVSLRQSGARHDLVDAVIGPASDDLLDITRRVEALAEFLATDDGANLMTGYRRASNIVRDEEARDKTRFAGEFDTALLIEPQEQALATAVTLAYEAASADADENDFAGALSELAALRTPVDTFFDKVLVNDPDPNIRANRLNLLARLRDCMHLVADFSKVEGQGANA